MPKVHETDSNAIFDIENSAQQGKCTPYTLAVLTEQFQVADLLAEYGFSDRNYKNADGENVLDIAKRLNLKEVQKYIVKMQKKTQEQNKDRLM